MAARAGLGFPVVLKIVSPDIAHKTEVGGVALDLADDGCSARRLSTPCWRSAAQKAPQARIDGVLVAPMARGGTELILGI